MHLQDGQARKIVLKAAPAKLKKKLHDDRLIAQVFRPLAA
jgi:hypothetical protein